MGAWGPGLYSSDFAMDLRPLVAALARLPIADHEFRRYASDANAGVADNPEDEDYSAFWLTLADQFAKKGIDCPYTRETALSIIDSGADIEMMRSLGMSESDLKKRQKNLEAIRDNIVAAAAGPKKPRKTLKSPQAFIMETGDCFAYPVRQGQAINPYMSRKETYDRQPWIADGWGAALVVETGRTLDYLVWYRLAAIEQKFAGKPTLDDARKARVGGGLTAGTCSPLHFRRMELEHLGRLPVRQGAIHELVPELGNVRSGDQAAIYDISVSNNLSVDNIFNRRFKGPLVADLLAT